MFTQIVMFLTVFFLVLTAINFYITNKKLTYPGIKLIISGLFCVAIAILSYDIRDIFVQLGSPEIQEKILKAGGVFHLTGSVLIFWFIARIFTDKSLRKAPFILGLFLILTTVISMQFFTIKGYESQAPLEPFPYTVIRNAPELENMGIIIIFIWLILVPLLSLGIVLYHVPKLINEKERKKAILYASGFFFLFFPMIICGFVSPIYARWGYLLGAVLIYKAFKVKA